MRDLLTLIAAILILAGCTNEVFYIEEPENNVKNNSPSEFSVEIKSITDKSVELKWSGASGSENDLISYDVAINDSIVAYEIAGNEYTLNNLAPDCNFKFTVIAHDPFYNISFKELNARTLKSFLQSYFHINLGYQEQTIVGSIKTSDGGFLICGVGSPFLMIRNDNLNFVAKINSDYTVVWKKEFAWDLQGGMSALESIDGSYFVAWTNTVLKLNQFGGLIWKYKCSESYKIESLTLISESNNNEILLSGVENFSPFRQSIIKLDQFGKELLHEWNGIYPTDQNNFITEASGETIVLGKSGSNSEGGQFKLSRIGIDGKLIKEVVYPNAYNGEDLVHSIVKVGESEYILAGSTYGNVNSMGMDFCPHLLKVSYSGEIIWDKFYGAISSEDYYFRTLKSFIKINSDRFLLFIEDNKGFTIAIINNEGVIIDFKRGSNYPNYRNFAINNLGQYILLTDFGIFIFNPDGYNKTTPAF